MKRTICVFICVLILLEMCAVSVFSSYVGDKTLVKADFGEFGYNYNLIDENGDKIGFNTSASSSVRKKAKAFSSLPSSYNSKTQGVITSVKNQGNTGSCWAFATCSALEADAISKGFKTPGNADFSEAHLVWFGYTPADDESDSAFGESYISSAPYLYGGNWIRSTAILSHWSGIADEKDFPYYPYSAFSMGNYSEDARYNRGSGLILDEAYYLTSVSEVKNFIMEHGAVTASIYYNKKYECTTSDNSSYFCNDFDEDTMACNHMITIVGWDDDYPASSFLTDSQPAYDGAFIIKDSWGTSSHKAGYYYLSYEDTSVCDFAGFTVQSAANYYHNYTYNAAGWSSAISYDDNLSVANIFSVNQSEALKSVSFYTIDLNTRVNVKIYNVLSDLSNPESGIKVYDSTFTFPGIGYHKVETDNEISLFPGSAFSVEITYLYDGETVYAPVEYTYGDMNYTCREGESFILEDDWTDVVDTQYEICNFCIQAFSRCRHQYEAGTIDPTCEEQGLSIEVCTQCGDYCITGSTPATGHTFGEWSDYEKTDSNYVRSTRTCSKCGKVIVKDLLVGTKVITLDFLIRYIFDKFFALFER